MITWFHSKRNTKEYFYFDLIIIWFYNKCEGVDVINIWNFIHLGYKIGKMVIITYRKQEYVLKNDSNNIHRCYEQLLSLLVGTEKRRSTSNMRPLYQKSRRTSSLPRWWSRWCVLKICVYIFDCLSSIGSNGPFPLPMYCAVPITSLDLIVCIYCLNDYFNSSSFLIYTDNSTMVIVSKLNKQ